TTTSRTAREQAVKQQNSGRLRRFGAPAATWRATAPAWPHFFGADRNGPVVFYEADLIPRITRVEALAVVRREAPSDARLVYDVRKPTCEMLQYRSAILKREADTRTMNAELSAHVDGGRYRGIVGNII